MDLATHGPRAWQEAPGCDRGQACYCRRTRKKPCSAIQNHALQIFAAVRGGENRPGAKEKRPTASPATHSQTWQCLCAVCLTRSVPKLSCWAPPLRPRAASTQQPTTCGPALFSRPLTGVTCSTLMSGGYAASKARENPFCGCCGTPRLTQSPKGHPDNDQTTPDKVASDRRVRHLC